MGVDVHSEGNSLENVLYMNLGDVNTDKNLQKNNEIYGTPIWTKLILTIRCNFEKYDMIET